MGSKSKVFNERKQPKAHAQMTAAEVEDRVISLPELTAEDVRRVRNRLRRGKLTPEVTGPKDRRRQKVKKEK